MITKQTVCRVLIELGLTLAGEPEVPNEGRIAKNFIVPTIEHGLIMIRLYPPDFDHHQVNGDEVAIYDS
jgi:hypothetical protein